MNDRKEANDLNIVLIGMPASGKSTVGVILAKVLGYDFVDSDLVIQRETGKQLSDLILERGIDGFIALENEVNCRIDPRRTVIATGGSAVYGQEAMEHLRRIGTVVYLETEFEDLQRRLHNIHQRGVVMRDGQDLRALYDERVPLYERYADIVIRESGAGFHEGIEETLSQILEALGR